MNMNTEDRSEKERGVHNHFAVQGGSEKQLLAPSWDFLPRNRAGGDGCAEQLASCLELHSLNHTPFSPLWLIFKHQRKWSG